jgi:hypothetical protein
MMAEHDDELDVPIGRTAGDRADAERVANAIAIGMERIAAAIEAGLRGVADAVRSTGVARGSGATRTSAEKTVRRRS